ncbi:hypothetical protein ABTX62_01990 [Streptomyces sp. NPDC096046]
MRQDPYAVLRALVRAEAARNTPRPPRPEPSRPEPDTRKRPGERERG